MNYQATDVRPKFKLDFVVGNGIRGKRSSSSFAVHSGFAVKNINNHGSNTRVNMIQVGYVSRSMKDRVMLLG